MRTPILLTGLYAAAILAVTCGGEDGDETIPDISQDAPRIRFCISGTMQGRLEPCGCASGQWGGLARRSFFLQGGQDFDILIEGGDMVTGGTELDFEKFYTAMQVLGHPDHPYDVVGIGAKDLELPTQDLVIGLFGIPAISSDVIAQDLPQEMLWPVKTHVEVEVRDSLVRIGSLTMALPEGTEGLSLLPPQEAWTRALEGAAESTLRVLMVHGAPRRVLDMARLEPSPDLVIGFSPAFTEPTAEPELVGKVPVVFAGTRGRMLLDLSLARLSTGPRVGARTVPLAGSQTVPGAMEDREIKQIILDHRHEVKRQGLLEKLADRLPTRGDGGATYVGTESCAECHVEDYEVWKGTRHSHAWQTLVDAENDPTRYGWPVTAYPDCVSCHSVAYGERSGFINMERTPQLGSVGCESCHGPGSAHISSGGKTVMGRVGVVGCTGCHDFEQTPDFDFPKMWEAIKHTGG